MAPIQRAIPAPSADEWLAAARWACNAAAAAGFTGVHCLIANREELNRLVGEKLARRTTSEWTERLNAAGVPCGPVLRTDEVFADPQVAHLGMVANVASPVVGDIGILRNAVTMTGGPPTVRSPAPEVGEHTTAVLRQFGVADHEIDDLRQRRVIA